MKGINKVILIGNVGKKPEIQYIEGNIPVAKFPMATTDSFKDRAGATISHTEWHNIVVWRGLAELAQKYLQKGSVIYVEGRLRTRQWEDKDKNRRFCTEIVADNLVMLDKRKDDSSIQSVEAQVAASLIAEKDTCNPDDIADNSLDLAL